MASEVVLALPHKLRVMRMYRTGLKELINWSATRHEWYPRVRKHKWLLAEPAEPQSLNKSTAQAWLTSPCILRQLYAEVPSVPTPRAEHRQAYALRQEFEDNKSLVRYDICGEHNQQQIWRSRRGRRGTHLRPVCLCVKAISMCPAHRLTVRRFARRWSTERSCWPVSGTGSPSSVSAVPNS